MPYKDYKKRRAYDIQWKIDHREEIRARGKIRYKWRMDNQPEFRERIKLNSFRYNKTLNGKFARYRRDTRKRGFYLTLEQFETFWRKDCYYCGRKITTIGLDRVNNLKSYTIDNVVSCCKKCNFLKGRTYDTINKTKIIDIYKKVENFLIERS